MAVVYYVYRACTVGVEHLAVPWPDAICIAMECPILFLLGNNNHLVSFPGPASSFVQLKAACRPGNEANNHQAQQGQDRAILANLSGLPRLKASISLSLSADPCNIWNFDTSNCTKWKDAAHLSTDPVSYESAESRITARFNRNTTHGQHHYVFCYKGRFHLIPRTIDCVHGKTSASVNFSWPFSGYADLLVMIYNGSSYNEKAFQACATTNISIACELIL